VARTDGTPAEPLHEEDVVEILLRQHERIRSGLDEVQSARSTRQEKFDALRALLAAHETAEEMVLRPVTIKTAGSEVATSVSAEEHQSTKVLADLEKMDVHSPEFETLFAGFRESVRAHAAHEERDEFPAVQKGRTPEELASMGRVLLAVEKIAPPHAHPSTAGSTTLNWAVGPFVSIVDRARDALSAATR
jgi:iron-sulfur cluster repair protein YtfE (RIC family)